MRPFFTFDMTRPANPYAYAALLSVLLVTTLIYLPGLNGSFLFDDFPNLERLGTRGPIVSWDLLRLYLDSGFAGPTGRPLSLLSFLIDANNWPADPWPFKRTNLVIHLAVGLVLFGTTRALLLSVGRSAAESYWLSLAATALWLVNPFLVSTTLYVVQRMTQLAALFVLAGIWCYLHGRALLTKSRTWGGYLFLGVGVPLCTLLATLSKENGALLPLLLLATQWALKDRWTTRGPSRLWTATYLALPSIAVAAYLVSILPDASAAYASREFTLYERLLSQPRFMWDYLYHLFVPHIQTQGLFQDGRLVSTGILSPWTTVPALLGVLAAIAAAVAVRKVAPLVTLAVIFFFAGHVLESTVVPLEMYFEHRNYLPSAFLFLPVVGYMYDRAWSKSRRLVTSGLVAAFGVYALATWQHATLWGDEDALLLVWAHTNPQSTRAQVTAAQTWLRNGEPERALATLEAANARMPNNALITGNILAVRAQLGLLTLAELEAGARTIRETKFDAQTLRALEILVNLVNDRSLPPDYARIVDELLEGIRDDLDGSIPPVHRMTFFLQGMLHGGQGDREKTLHYFIQALEHYNTVDAGLRMVAELAGFGYYEEGLEMLDRSEALFLRTDMDAPHQRHYETAIHQLRMALLEDIDSTRIVAPADTTSRPDRAASQEFEHD